MDWSERIPRDGSQHNDTRVDHGGTTDHRPREQGLLGRPAGDLRHRRLSRQVLLPALQDAGLPLELHERPTQPGKEITWGELHVGSRQVFADAGFTEVSHPSPRRVVMRIDVAN
jgi:hypothetical protein